MIAPAERTEEIGQHTVAIDGKSLSEAITKTASSLVLMFLLALPFLGLFAGIGVNVFRWVTGI